jgi:putative peptidoglycan lipid II flippase
LLLKGLLRTGIYRVRPGWRAHYAQVLAASAVMTLALIWSLRQVESWLLLGRLERVAILLACVGGAAIVYFSAGWLLGLRVRDLRMRAVDKPV